MLSEMSKGSLERGERPPAKRGKPERNRGLVKHLTRRTKGVGDGSENRDGKKCEQRKSKKIRC